MGLFGKGKVADIQAGIDKGFQKFKKDLEKRLGKLGLKLEYAGLSGADPVARKGGTLIARFNDSDGFPITLVQGQEIYEGSPHGSLVSVRKVYRPYTIWGTIVNGSMPFTLLFKEVGKGFLKGSAKMFLPFDSFVFNEKEAVKSPLLQTPVVAALNSDEQVCENISKLSLKTSLSLTHKASVNINCLDQAGKCVIIPTGNETAVFLRNYGIYGETSGGFSVSVFSSNPIPESMFQTISSIRQKIINHSSNESIVGKVPATWVNTLYTLSKAKV